LHPDQLAIHQPDYVLILPWNIADEVKSQNNLSKEMAFRFVTAVPELVIQ
jgi:hypothetical protein